MMKIDEYLDTGSVAILGHVRPDGDCVGSTMAMYNYIVENYPDVVCHVYLGNYSSDFKSVIANTDKILQEYNGETHDLCIVLDVSSDDRFGDFKPVFDNAAKTILIDHHITNPGFADINVIDAKASAASELLFRLLDHDKISPVVADCLYMGIIHDTGCFNHDNAGPETLRTAGDLLEKGAHGSVIIRDTFTKQSFRQIHMVGECMCKSQLLLDGKFVFTSMTLAQMERFGGNALDLEPVVDRIRVTDGTLCAAFAREASKGSWRVSFRTGCDFNVADIAAVFGGGGHIKAAGCTVEAADEAEIMKKLTNAVKEAIRIQTDKN